MARGQKDDPLLAAVRSMEIPLNESEGILARCALGRSGESYHLKYDKADEVRERIAEVTGIDHAGVPLVCVPLVGRKETIGVLAVDNRFLPHERDEIPDDMVGRLAAYAELAAMSIETNRLLERTQTQTYEDLAHQLRSPLALSKSLVESVEETAVDRSKLDLLRAAVHKAARVSISLRRFADLARGRALALQKRRLLSESILRQIKESTMEAQILADPARKLDLQIEDSGFLQLREVEVNADPDLVRDSLEVLLDNAIKYSFRETTISVRAEVSGNRTLFDVIVENTGIGITAEESELAKGRSWRGQKAMLVTGEGSGIGLWVVDNIMTTHAGRLIVYPTDDANLTRVALRFPVGNGGGEES